VVATHVPSNTGSVTCSIFRTARGF